MTVEVSEAQKRLYFLNFLWLRPIPDDLDFCIIHFQAIGADDETQEVGGVDVELALALVNFGIQVVGVKALENFLYMSGVIRGVFGIDKNVIQIYYYADIQKVLENVIHKPLERGRGIGESIMHDVEFIRAVMGVESGLPSISIGYVDQVVCTVEAQLGERASSAKSVEQVGMKGSG